MALVKKYGDSLDDFDSLFKEVGFEDYFPVGWRAVFDTIKNMPTTDDYELEWKPIDKEAIIDLLVNKHDFSKERVLDKINSLDKELKKAQQTGLNQFFA